MSKPSKLRNRLFRSVTIALLAVLPALLSFTSCHYPKENDGWNMDGTTYIDSATFIRTHHYWINTNFVATDSFKLMSRAPFFPSLTYTADSQYVVNRSDLLVVEDIKADTSLSSSAVKIWLKVAGVKDLESDTSTTRIVSGWIQENHFLKDVSPNYPISKMIIGFSNMRFKIISCTVALFLLMLIGLSASRKKISLVHFNDIDSLYPTLFCMAISGEAVIYQSIQVFIPDTWTEYYFHPTLNPFNPRLPLIMSLLISSVWFTIVVGIATLDELRRKIQWPYLFGYVVGLATLSLTLYMVFAVVCPVWVSYPLLLAYWIFAIVRYRRFGAKAYLCGNCGRPIGHSGVCPYCGAMNVE